MINETYARSRAYDEVSKSQLHKIHAKLRQVLKRAVREDILIKNLYDVI